MLGGGRGVNTFAKHCIDYVKGDNMSRGVVE